MSETRLNRPFALITLLVVAFIVYGSLFPFQFHARSGNALASLLATRHFRLEHFGNLIGNIFLYIPLGLFGVLAMRDRFGAALRLGFMVSLGVLLCVALELTQFHVAGRVSTFADIYPNTIGTALGAIAGLALGVHRHGNPWRGQRIQPVPMLLLCLFLAYRLFPYVPSLDLHQYWQALKPVVRDPHWTAYDITHYIVIWLVVAALLRALAGATYGRLLLMAAMAGVLAAKVAIMNNSLSAAELIGAAVALVFWLAVSRMPDKTGTIAVALALAVFVAAERLQPFDFHATGHAFGWIPFRSFMQGSMAINALSFLEKCFLYGSLIWLLSKAGLRLLAAGVSVSLALLATSAAQTHLAGRSAEITDAVMALLITGLFALIAKSTAAEPGVPNDYPADLLRADGAATIGATRNDSVRG